MHSPGTDGGNDVALLITEPVEEGCENGYVNPTPTPFEREKLRRTADADAARRLTSSSERHRCPSGPT